MSEPTMVDRLVGAELVHGLTDAEREALAGLSENEFAVLTAIKAQLDDALGVDSVHGPEDGGLFW